MKLAALAVALAAAAAGCGQARSGPGTTEAGAQELPDVALIECEVNGARVLTPEVRPQADGLHLEIKNDTGSELGFSAEDANGGGRGAGAPTGSVRYVWPLPPGNVFVKCTNDQADPSEIPGTELSVVDQGIWVSTDLYSRCRQASTTQADYGAGAAGEKGDPVAIAREAFEHQGLEAGDVVERAGYPAGEETILRVTRSGDVVATISLLSDGAGGWLIDQTTVCENPPAFG